MTTYVVEFERTALCNAEVDIDLVDVRRWLDASGEAGTAITGDVLREYVEAGFDEPFSGERVVDWYSPSVTEVRLP